MGFVITTDIGTLLFIAQKFMYCLWLTFGKLNTCGDPTKLTFDVNVFCREFEHLAVMVLDECFNKHQKHANEILRRKCPMWANKNCLELAAQAEAKVATYNSVGKSE